VCFMPNIILANNMNFHVSHISVSVIQLYFVCIYIHFAYHQLDQEIEDTKGVIRIRKSKKDRQRNGEKKKNKRTNNDLQNIHIKLKIE